MPETIEQTVQRLSSVILEKYPDLDLSPGSVLTELLLKPAAYAQNEITNRVEKISVLSAIDNPQNMDPVILDSIASNYTIKRKPGVKSTGKVRVFTTGNAANYSVEAETIFVNPASGLQYVSTQPVIVVQNQLNLLGAERYFDIDVEAVEAGAAYQLRAGDSFVLEDEGLLPDASRMVAAFDFSEGRTQESNEALIARLRSGLNSRGYCSRDAIVAALNDAFDWVANIKVIGPGTPEMKRSKRNPLGIDQGGKVDLYIRSGRGIERVTLTKPVVTDPTPTQPNRCYVEITPEDRSASGYYSVVSLTAKQGGAAFTVLNQEFSAGSVSGWPILVEPEDARFSALQKSKIYFNNNAANPSTEVNVTVLVQRGIADLQDFFSPNGQGWISADYLVKAAVPCFVAAKVRVNPSAGGSININALRIAIVEYINSRPFGDSVVVSGIIDLCHNFGARRVDLPLVLGGQIIPPAGLSVNLAEDDELTIPNLLAGGVTQDVVSFFTTPQDITIEIF